MWLPKEQAQQGRGGGVPAQFSRQFSFLAKPLVITLIDSVRVTVLTGEGRPGTKVLKLSLDMSRLKKAIFSCSRTIPCGRE